MAINSRFNLKTITFVFLIAVKPIISSWYIQNEIIKHFVTYYFLNIVFYINFFEFASINI